MDAEKMMNIERFVIILQEIENRVRPTICDTYSSNNGLMSKTREGRISEADLDAIQVIASWIKAPIWQPMATAPQDREIIVYCPPREGLGEIYCKCQWHPDAGFCVDEIREPTLWTEVAEVKS